jgi:enamine deaminase RidA (YjgF/YER057c/UK114 family)
MPADKPNARRLASKTGRKKSVSKAGGPSLLMRTRTSEAAGVVQPVLPVKLGPGAVHYAQGVRAGRWLFATGLMAQDFKTGVPESVTAPAFPLFDASPAQREAAMIFDHLDKVLAAGGTSCENIIRIDQFFTNIAAIAPYQATRRKRLGAITPASTSMVMEALPLLNATMLVDALAVIPAPDFQPRAVVKPDVIPVSGPSPSVIVGDFVFVSGQLATADPGAATRDGLPQEACVPATAYWGGQAIQAETNYVLRRRISPALERAGSSVKNVVKAQVYLTHLEDLQTFRQVWIDYFGGELPATTIVVAPKRSIGIAAARVEINIIALRDGAVARKEIIEYDVAPAYAEFPAAVKAGDLLFLSGLMANDANGVALDVKATANQPLYGSSAQAQASVILEKAETICAAAGTSLANIVRAQHFLTDLSEFYGTHNALRQRLGERALPFSAVGVPGPMPIPGCSMLMDLWFYAPGKS